MVSIPGYDIHERLYESAQSLIYRGRRQSDQLPVILKVMRHDYPTPRELARFRREYEMTRSLRIEGVIEVYGLETYEHTLLMTLEDFGGESLNQLLSQHPFTLAEFLPLAIRITEILARIHQCRIMHKDINPANIIWNPAADQVKIIDFGIATTLVQEQPEIRNPNLIEGTLAYMSPEQTGRMNRVVDYRTDLYSLGATLYQILTGQLPFQADDPMEMLHCHLAKTPVPPSDIPLLGGVRGGFPQILSAIILKLMAKNAEDRYQSAVGVIADLEYCLANLTGHRDLSGFMLAQQDIPEGLRIPQKLYGRERDLEALLNAFAQVANPRSDLSDHKPPILLVTGYAGIGKSALVHEIYKPITVRRGYFIAGKLDQFKHNIPYAAIIQAFQSLVRQLLSESADQLALWKERILNACGSNGQVLVAVIPKVELVIGPQPEIPELPPLQAQNRFNFVFQNFVRAIATAEHPLAIFLDDLQWIDSPSLKLLELLMSDSQTHFMLIVGAYRENEVTDAHPLMLTLREIQQTGAIVKTITLQSLDLEHVAQLIANTLRLPSEICIPLAELTLQKTGGNPFFLRQFLHALHDEGLLEFDANHRKWTWELATIRRQAMTANVVEFMSGKLQKLPQATQQVLQLAACIGNQFDLQTLAIVYEKSPDDAMHDLWNALQERLVLPLSDAYKYVRGEESGAQGEERKAGGEFPSWEGQGWVNVNFKFLHDRVQQAAYALLAEDRKKETHLKIGRLLLANTRETDREERMFEIANHLNSGQELITAQAEKENLAQLNLLAGRKARTSAAYQAAYAYLNTGLELLQDDCWRQQYELTLALYTETAEAAYLCGEFAWTEQLVEMVLQHARTLLDKVKAYEIKIEADKAQNKLPAAFQTGLAVLKLLGVTFPEKPNKLHILVGLLRIKLCLAGKSIEDFANLPEMTDPYKLAAMRIMKDISTLINFVRPELIPLLCFEAVELSLKYGNASTSTYFYTGYGFTLCMLGDIDSGFRFGKLALDLVGRLDIWKLNADTIVVLNSNITHWKKHVSEILPPLQEAYQNSLETGALEITAFAAYLYSQHAYSIGKELTEVEQKMALYSALIGKLKQTTVRHYHDISWQTVRNLIGQDALESPPWCLAGDAYNEEQMQPLHHQAHDNLALFFLFYHRLLLCYLFQAYPQAIENAALTETVLESGAASFLRALFHFYDSLTRLAVYCDASKTEQWRIRRKVAANQKKMKTWAFHAPMNYLHKYRLVEAEHTRVLGKDLQAMEYYDQAIAGAREHEYLNDEALANELAGRFYLARGQVKIAQIYLREARYCYLKWGANAKVQQLDRTYPDLLKAEYLPLDRIRLTLTDTTTETHVEVLELATIMKAAQILSSEIVLTRLLERLMDIMLANAGAEKGMLLFEQEGQWMVKTEKDTRVDRLQTSVSAAFPAAIIAYAARVKQPVVLEHAAQDTQFMRDEYIAAQQCQSVLCLPLVNQGRLISILYLENNLTPGAFTPERVDILTLLASQAAISIEKALLYATLEQQVQARTRELEQEITERQRAEEAAQAANQAKTAFLTQLSHELRTPLNSIFGYTQLLKRNNIVMEQAREAIETIQQSGAHLLALINELLDLSRIESRTIALVPTPVHLPGFFKQLEEMTRIQAQQAGLTFLCEIESDVPLMVHVDEQHLRQILLNLLNNAIKFTEHGKVTLRVGSKEKGVTDGVHTPLLPTPYSLLLTPYCLHFEIEDTGVGIAPEDLTNIFQPFYQAGRGPRSREGAGLGLSISQQLVRLMGSDLHVRSVLGQGTTFWFDLVLPGSPETAVPLHGFSQIRGYTGPARKILVVDDHEQNRAFVKELLEQLGFDVLEAVDGRDALEILNRISQVQQTFPELILMDLLMPGLDGIETTRAIRQSQEFPQMAIIGVSASAESEIRQQCLAAGCDDFLAKPIRLEDLLECLRRYLNLEWIEEQSGHAAPEDETDILRLKTPPHNVLFELKKLAENGYITDLKHALAALKRSDADSAPFVEILEHYAERLQFDRIAALITTVMQRG